MRLNNVASAFECVTAAMSDQQFNYSFVDSKRAGPFGNAMLWVINESASIRKAIVEGPVGVVGSVVDGVFDLLDCEVDTAVLNALGDLGRTVGTAFIAPCTLAGSLFALSVAGGGFGNLELSYGGAGSAGGYGGASAAQVSEKEDPSSLADGTDPEFGNAADSINTNVAQYQQLR
jgi:hypothetical protein